MASIRKRGNRWQVQVRQDGCRSISRTFSSKATALKWSRHKEHQADLAELPISNNWRVREKNLRICDIVDRYKKEVSVLKKSASVEHFYFLQITRHKLGNIPLAKLVAANIAEYRDDRLRTVSGSTVRRELGLLRHILKIASTEWGYTGLVEIIDQIRKPSPGQPRDRRMTRDELARLDIALHQCQNPLVRQIFYFALHTGIRRGEILTLTWANLNLEESTALLPITKNGIPRTIPLSPSALNVLDTIRKLNLCSKLVFPISANALRLAWERAKRRAEIKDFRFHDLRHEAISRFFEIGLMVPEVALISGHKDVRMLFRYTHLRPEDVAHKLSLK